jgi:hypothetical protein
MAVLVPSLSGGKKLSHTFTISPVFFTKNSKPYLCHTATPPEKRGCLVAADMLILGEGRPSLRIIAEIAI